jgi:hypothetical protein
MTTPHNDTKTKIARMAIREDVEGRLRCLGVSREFPAEAIKKLFDILDSYVDLPDDATSGFSGRIPFPEIGKDIEYVLPLRGCNRATVRMVASR